MNTPQQGRGDRDQAGSDQFLYAFFVQRVVAAVIDIALLAVVMNGVGLLVWAIIGDGGGETLGTERSSATENWLLIASVFVGWAYFAGMESSPIQATLGKIVLGIYVTDNKGGRVTFMRATARYYGKFLAIVTFGLSIFVAAFGRKRQAMHDMLASCFVLAKRSRFTPSDRRGPDR